MTEKKEETMSILAKIERVDRRVLYWALIVLIIIPTLAPMGMPIPISAMTRKFHEALQAVPSGGIVLLDCSFSVGSLPEIGPGGEVMGKYLADRPVKTVIWSVTTAEGPMLAEKYVIPHFQKAGKKYGTDYVNLGYIPGEDITLAKLAADMSYVKKDYHGTDTSQIPLFSGLKTARDVALAIVIEAGGEGSYYVGQWYTPYKAPVATICTGVLVPIRIHFFQAGQMAGIAPGSRGIAELELLTGFKGTAVATQDVLSVTHLYVLLAVIAGNVAFLYRKRMKR
jgi:hypothetical protein